MRNYSYIYESAMQDNFERQILSGYLTEEKVKELVENNQLNEDQMKVVEELFPALGGLKNVAKGAMSGIKGAYQKGKDLYQQGKQQAESDNFKKLQAAQWKALDQTIKNGQVLQKMEKLKSMFPQDKFVNDVTAYFNKALSELQEYLSRQYPYMGIQSTGQPFQSELDQQQQNQSANTQIDTSVERDARSAAGVTPKPTQNTRRGKIPSTSLKQRQRAMPTESWDRMGNIP